MDPQRFTEPAFETSEGFGWCQSHPVRLRRVSNAQGTLLLDKVDLADAAVDRHVDGVGRLAVRIVLVAVALVP